MDPINAHHRDMKLVPDGARMTIASGLRLHKQCIHLVVRKMAPLAELAPFSGATM